MNFFHLFIVLLIVFIVILLVLLVVQIYFCQKSRLNQIERQENLAIVPNDVENSKKFIDPLTDKISLDYPAEI